jgi:D-alanine-D-alanine ligase
MGHLERWNVVIVHNRDFDPTDQDDPATVSRADVENAARDVARALRGRGHTVEIVSIAAPVGGEGLPGAVAAGVERAIAHRPDLVFNLCESLAGDARHEGVVPSLLELAGVPYTGSGPVGLGLCLRKDRAKRLLEAYGVPTPAAQVVRAARDLEAIDLPYPLIVKPSREDASLGIERDSVVRDRAALRRKVGELLVRFRQPILVERFIVGREIYVSLIGDEADGKPELLGMHEIDFSRLPAALPRIVSYAGKWDTASVDYRATRPVRAVGLDARATAALHGAARAAFVGLELRDYGRVDVRLADDGTPYVIDVNPNCDLSEGAGVCRAAAFFGLAYPDLIERVCTTALKRAKRESEDHFHGHRARATQQPRTAAAGRADGAAHAAARSRRVGGDAVGGRAVHDRGAVGGARAHRRRTRRARR